LRPNWPFLAVWTGSSRLKGSNSPESETYETLKIVTKLRRIKHFGIGIAPLAGAEYPIRARLPAVRQGRKGSMEMKRVVGILGLLVLLAAPAFAGEPLWYTGDDFWRLCPSASPKSGCRGLEQAFIDADREERAKIIRALVEAIEARQAEQAAQRAAQEAERKRDLIIQTEQQQRERQLQMEQERVRIEQQKLEELRKPTTLHCSTWYGTTTCREYKDEPAIRYQPR